MQTENNEAIMRNTTWPCFKPFCFEVHCQLHHYLPPLIFGLTLFGWFVSVYLSIFHYENIIFDLRHFDLRPLFSGKQLELQTIYRHARYMTMNKLFDPMFVELLYVKPVSRTSNRTVILTSELLSWPVTRAQWLTIVWLC